jgi:galactonate dehydratase
VAATIVDELLAPLLRGRDPQDVGAIYEDLYNAMRVRGYFGGFYCDALAAIDIALWDLKGKQAGMPVAKLLGGQRRTRIPAYVSGLPKPELAERVSLALHWRERGFGAFKFAAAISHQGIVEEMRALRDALGPDAMVLCDMHWKFTPARAVQVIRSMEPFQLRLAEAPVPPEDVPGLARVARSVATPIAGGEELRTRFEFRSRFEVGCFDVIQPEVGRTGLTEFWHICQMAYAFDVEVMPHASIGIGVFQAASLHAAAALPLLPMHEYQHSIFDRNLRFIRGSMRCEAGHFHVPEGPGLGVEPAEELFEYDTARSSNR